MNKQLELEALITERAGMDAENAWRATRGEASAYGMEHYQELASRMRELETPSLEQDDFRCGESEIEGVMEMITWLDNAPFLMGKLTERDRAIRENIIGLIKNEEVI